MLLVLYTFIQFRMFTLLCVEPFVKYFALFIKDVGVVADLCKAARLIRGHLFLSSDALSVFW